ncbi:MAG: alpha-amylase family glycosyl hydrolase [Chthoniobacter sp.]
MTGRILSQGAEVTSNGVHYRVWAPKPRRVAVQITGHNRQTRTFDLSPEVDGYFSGLDAAGAAGDKYAYQLEGGEPLPCPASRYQPDGVSGPSMVIDPHTFSWTDQKWSRPAFRDLAIYELHVGTFTPEGTYRAAIERLPYLRELGVNAIEVMPLADFPGEYNWGYDGVRLFAPARIYGSPDDLRALVDARTPPASRSSSMSSTTISGRMEIS